MSVNLQAQYDEASSEAIRSIWRAIAEAGFTNRMLERDYRPHMTLAAADLLEFDAFDRDARVLANSIPPFTLHLTAWSSFGRHSGFLYLAPAASEELLSVHRRFSGIFEKHADKISPYYRSGRWTPHCTVASGLHEEEMLGCMDLLLRRDLPLELRMDSIGLVQYPSADALAHYSLGEGAA